LIDAGPPFGDFLFVQSVGENTVTLRTGDIMPRRLGVTIAVQRRNSLTERVGIEREVLGSRSQESGYAQVKFWLSRG
jgi:hypothetical protein